jgi:hypothetical protein
VIVFFGAFESKFYNFRYFNQIFHFVWNITITRFCIFLEYVTSSDISEIRCHFLPRFHYFIAEVPTAAALVLVVVDALVLEVPPATALLLMVADATLVLVVPPAAALLLVVVDALVFSILFSNRCCCKL